MIYVTRSSAATDRERLVAGVVRRAARRCVWIAALGLMLTAPVAAIAADLDTGPLRGSFSNIFSPTSYSRWDGVNFGVMLGQSNMNADFSSALSTWLATDLSGTFVESEFHPSQWSEMPNTSSNSRSYSAFLGYNYQWDQLVLGLDAGYTRMSSMETSSSGSVGRSVHTSDGLDNTVIIFADGSLKLIDYATVRARAGYAFGQFLPYAVIGAAAGRFDYTRNGSVTTQGIDNSGPVPKVVYGPITDTFSDAKNNAMTAGLVAGAGLDVALLPNVFLRGEWEFIMFAPVGGMKATVNTGRVGIGVKF